MSSMQSYEVEIKALLGSSERADEVRAAMKKLDPACMIQSKNEQLNHYFEGGDLHKLSDYFSPMFPEDTRRKFLDLARRAKTYSVRTRDKSGEVILVIKVAVDETTSENGISRMELENKMDPSSGIKSIEQLDKLIIASGFQVQAKWSRLREEYVCKGVNVTLDKNAGYGWLAEFERMVSDETLLGEARASIASLMESLGVRELPQDRLERMFKFYNSHWREYYGTDKIFTVE
ncbi:hypothetical protein A3B33_02580 [Candidatus Adlerbacteria bacterium RIFCSPLOWO2_01_FULL_54_16]|uniref:CYTH domain-containing protein n=2 Tax=Parcubacteria group TaxID=1794811 RepID=A0A1F4Y0M0_9BACT|nr:MAG: hypothetical protein A3B33_02580 [Candidatus Adlerbacteria bacterium RIFCSPLOWO2_01_FULL_54_16]